jgi:hypothetical protein
MKMNQEDVEIFIDLNAGKGKGYSLEIRGAVQGLKNLGLSLEQAVGMRLIFNGGEDTNEAGEPAEILFKGVVIKDEKWGYLAMPDEKGIYWRMS